MKKGRDVKSERWLLVWRLQRRLASRSPRENASHHTEMQGLPPTASWKRTDLDVWSADSGKASSTSSAVLKNQRSFSPGPGVTSYKGSDLLDSLSSKDKDNSG